METDKFDKTFFNPQKHSCLLEVLFAFVEKRVDAIKGIWKHLCQIDSDISTMGQVDVYSLALQTS